MCHTNTGHHRRNRDRLLRLKSITIHLSVSATSTTTSFFPDSLTFVFPPRINGGRLQINDSYFPMDLPAFLSLHRRGGGGGSAIFTSDDRVSVSDGAVFEVHVFGNHLVRGVFRRGDGGGMKMECKCVAVSEVGVDEAVVITAAEGGGVMREKVKVAKRRRFCRKYELALEEIPEERECDVDDDDDDMASGDDVEGHGVVCTCNCSCDDHDEGRIELDGGYEFDHMMEMEMEGVRWAVDMGIWAVCIGLGFLVSKASVRSLRRCKKILIV